MNVGVAEISKRRLVGAAMARGDLFAQLSLFCFLSASTLYCFYKSRRLKHPSRSWAIDYHDDASSSRRGKLFFVSKTGTSRALAHRLFDVLSSNNLPFDLVDPENYEPEDLQNENLVLIIASTWEDGKPTQNSKFLYEWITESAEDFRVGSLLLSRCEFAVFGVGSRSYGSTYNAVGKKFSKCLKALGASELLPFGNGDVDDGKLDDVFSAWCKKLVAVMKKDSNREVDGPILRVGSRSDCEYESNDEFDSSEAAEGDIVDLEDIAGKAPSKQSAALPMKTNVRNGQREMITPVVRANLEKQGYKIIGSHSGIKICRWTKSQLRGRGGCYKHSFYGIESHRCMEATPSLACANKCIFCWRHHTNPVGKSWQWKMDDPLDIVNSAIELHSKMIRQMKGVPGVTPERLSEGLSPRHCALSLVGEPIMYPEINSLVDELHRRQISTFLVTNAQFPEKIQELKPVTQLYVSVDAATKESLKAIDRPLFGDFWERFLDSLKYLRMKQQRTVYRLTLVKGWNSEDIDAYSGLFLIGQPDFVEIKGVTYCGSSATSKLTMEHVPWHADVKTFSEALALKSCGEYEVACEHAHSCCVLLARAEKFKINGQWFTWIDYEKFHALVSSGAHFSSKDYMAPTPSWALYGAEEGGFDPDQARYRKERHHRSAR